MHCNKPLDDLEAWSSLTILDLEGSETPLCM